MLKLEAFSADSVLKNSPKLLIVNCESVSSGPQHSFVSSFFPYQSGSVFICGRIFKGGTATIAKTAETGWTPGATATTAATTTATATPIATATAIQ